MSLSTHALILQSLIVILDLFDEIQRNGELSPEALEQKIAQARDVRKALVEEAGGESEVEEPEVEEPEVEEAEVEEASHSSQD